jgi:arylsulfatase A-like enzyme
VIGSRVVIAAMSSRRTHLFSACLPWSLGLALTLAACGADPGPQRRVVLITCDTLRADRLGAYGYEAPVSPRLDAFAAEGVVFESAYSSAPWTRPALSSLMTGRYAEEVGAAPGNLRMMPASVETLAERIAAHGIPTAAVVSNGLIRRPPERAGDVDLAQGFGHYDDTMTAREKNRDMPERPAGDTTRAAMLWLADHEGRGGGPFFLWVHYQDPHGPYTPPPEVAQQFERPLGENEREDAPLPAGTSMRGFRQIPRYQVLEQPGGRLEQRPRIYRDRYDAEIAHFDAELGRLLAWLRAQAWYEDSLVIFSADHGESLGERDYWFCHGENVQREVLRVPLIVRYPRGLSGPRAALRDGFSRVDALVGHVDLWPTVLAALGLPESGSRGIALTGAELPAERVLAQSFLTQKADRRQWAATDGRWRLIWGSDGSARLHDLRSDPREERDIAAEHPAEVERLRRSYRESLELVPQGAHQGSDVAVDAAGLQALQQLGYAEVENAGDQE